MSKMGFVFPKGPKGAGIATMGVQPLGSDLRFPRGTCVKSFDSRVYSINDFVEWDRREQLVLNPAFQRRDVWSDKAKSFLMDTIIRGKPIPKVFIRQKLNVTSRTSVREVVDGQQRLRTILSFVKDGFVINRRHNKEFGSIYFSQLDPDIQAQLLTYEISADMLINLPDSEILDIFGRLNSYAVVLNEQEKINAEHFGPFKVVCDKLGRNYKEYWVENRIFTEKNILRMLEVNLVADMLIAVFEGVKAKKQVSSYFDKYEEIFDRDVDDVEITFAHVIVLIGRIYPEGLSSSEFSRPFLFYTLFVAAAACLHSVPGLENFGVDLFTDAAVEKARNGLDRIGTMFSAPDTGLLAVEERVFMQDSRRATTDQAPRERRVKFLLGLMR